MLLFHLLSKRIKIRMHKAIFFKTYFEQKMTAFYFKLYTYRKILVLWDNNATQYLWQQNCSIVGTQTVLESTWHIFSLPFALNRASPILTGPDRVLRLLTSPNSDWPIFLLIHLSWWTRQHVPPNTGYYLPTNHTRKFQHSENLKLMQRTSKGKQCFAGSISLITRQLIYLLPCPSFWDELGLSSSQHRLCKRAFLFPVSHDPRQGSSLLPGPWVQLATFFCTSDQHLHCSYIHKPTSLLRALLAETDAANSSKMLRTTKQCHNTKDHGLNWFCFL